MVLEKLKMRTEEHKDSREKGGVVERPQRFKATRLFTNDILTLRREGANAIKLSHQGAALLLPQV